MGSCLVTPVVWSEKSRYCPTSYMAFALNSPVAWGTTGKECVKAFPAPNLQVYVTPQTSWVACLPAYQITDKRSRIQTFKMAVPSCI